MSRPIKDLSQSIQGILQQVLREERQTKETELVVHEVEARISISRESNISEVLTGIRILPGIAVCTQIEPAVKTKGGDSMLHINVRWVPKPGTPEEWIQEIGNLIKSATGVKIVRIVTFDGGEVAIGPSRKPALF